MTILLDKCSLYSTFSVNGFEELKSSIESIAPSMAEYYLSDLASLVSDNLYLNKTNIEQTLHIDNYALYLDYNQDIYLETLNTDDNVTQDSLW